MLAIIELLSVAREYTDNVPPVSEDKPHLEALLDEVNKVLMDRYSERLEKPKRLAQHPYSFKFVILTWAHLLRLPIANKKLQDDQQFVIEKGVGLCCGLLQISSTHGWLNVSGNIVEVMQVRTLGVREMTRLI